LGKRDGVTVPHRMWVYFNVDFRFPPERVIGIVEDALRGSPIPRVAAEPPPNCICMDFARDGRDSFGYYAVRYFLTDISADDPTRSAVRARIWAALKRAGVPLAKPAHAVFMTPDDELSHEKRKERHRQARLGALRNLELFKALTDDERASMTAHL